MKKILSLIHRVLLHVWPYKKLVYGLGLDSYRYKKYYKKLHYPSTDRVTAEEVDGYSGEGEFEKIIALMDNLARSIPVPVKVLDIGCGTGRYLKQMTVIWPDACLEGIDISKEIVEKFTRKEVPNSTIHVMDIETDNTFHLKNKNTFSLVCLIGIIQILSIKKIQRILDKIHTLCVEGGYLYIQFNTETTEKKTSIGYKRYSIPELTALLEQHGFKTLKSDRTDILKDYAYIIATKKDDKSSGKEL